MNLLKNLFFKGMLFLTAAMVFTNCQKEDSNSINSEIKGNVEFEITDAPIDDSNISGAFVTVTAVKVDGEVISSFSGKQTIDLMAYQNGNTKGLGLAELETGSYTNVSLVLDYAADVNGNAPGCYVLTTDNKKHSLQSTSSTTSEITLSSTPFEVSENSTTKMVIDFDVRKAIKTQDNPQPDDKYDFVTEAELRGSLRVVNKDKSGKVKGKVSDMLSAGGDRIVVYAYKKGSFDTDIETQGQGSSNIMFKKAETSAVVDANGNYDLSFLPEGDYELHYVGYEEDSDGKMEAKGMLQVNALAALDLLGFELDASASVEVNVTVTGIILF